jgi:large subunit ribosomal protein L32
VPNPKRRHSQARRDKRRANWALKPPTLVPCGNCAALKKPHFVCPTCGTYNGRQVLSLRRTASSEA